MKSCGRSGRSKGVMCLVRDSVDHSYASMAKSALRLASHFLEVPTMIHQVQDNPSWVNFRSDVDTQETVPWHNHGRWQAYDASPWDETIVIDADYLVMTDTLAKLWGSQSDYMLCHHNSMLKHKTQPLSPVLVWATVFWFRKSTTSHRFFEMVSRVERGYHHCAQVFNVPGRGYRNDVAFAMADQIISGHRTLPERRMPVNITTVDYSVNDIQADDDWIVVRGNDRADVLPRQDLHVMSKNWMQGPGIVQLLGTVL